jgi:hypothetical protein
MRPSGQNYFYLRICGERILFMWPYYSDKQQWFIIESKYTSQHSFNVAAALVNALNKAPDGYAGLTPREFVEQLARGMQ